MMPDNFLECYRIYRGGGSGVIVSAWRAFKTVFL